MQDVVLGCGPQHTCSAAAGHETLDEMKEIKQKDAKDENMILGDTGYRHRRRRGYDYYDDDDF